jgi:rhodanese-related sulfurtransferase
MLAANIKNPVTEKVKIIRIDDAVATSRAVGVIQLDVEGYEAQALAGAMDTIARCKPVVVLETVPRRSERVMETLKSLGYSARTRCHTNTVFAAS